LAVLSWDQYEALVETLDILGDEEQTAQLRRAVAEIKAGTAQAWEGSEEVNR